MKNIFRGIFKQDKLYSYKIVNSILIITAFIATLILIINGSYIKEGYKASVGSISDHTFFAPNDIINQVATDKLIEKARTGVPDVYNHNSEIDGQVIVEINTFFNRLNNEPISFNDDAPTGITENIFINQTHYDYIMALPIDKRNDLQSKILTITQNALKQGIRNETLDTSLTLVKDSVEVLQYDNTGTEIAFNIISGALKPNLIVDDKATEKLRQEKVDEVEPVKVLANQKIVGEGEIITEEIYSLLENSGFLKKEGFRENLVQISGIFILLAVVFALFCGYLFTLYKDFYTNIRNCLLLYTIYIMLIVMTYFMTSLPYVFVPVMAFTMLTTILFGIPIAFFINLLISVVAMWIYKGDLSFLIFFWVGGSIVTISMNSANERNKILYCGLVNSVIFAILMIGIQLFFNLYWKGSIIKYTVSAFLSGIVSIIICIGSIPIIESSFGIVTDYKLQDLTGSKQKLMRRLMLEAPGTYHHSLVVANLAEAAAYAIGANPNIARAGACYHDIGKLFRPMFFGENMHGSNIHEELNPYESARIIMSHVTEGEKLAEKHKLPTVIRNIIAEHHGTSLIKFFFYKQKQMAETDANTEQPKESDFRHVGRLPSTKESGIIMIADTVEAAVRSAISKGMTEDDVLKFIKDLIKDKINDGQLNKSGLTINDLDKISDAFFEIFKGMYHERVAYPGQEKKE